MKFESDTEIGRKGVFFKGLKSPMYVLALIPARGGSKSIPKKNLVTLDGYPLIAYSIASGLAAASVERVIVSTDCPEIAEIASDFGAEVPFRRPDELARDETPDLPVFEHVLDWLLREEGKIPDAVVQLRPTSPIRPRGLIDRAVELFAQSPPVDCVRGVVPSEENPFKMWLMEEADMLRPLITEGFNEPYNMPRQQLPQTFWQTGHIDVIRSSTIMESHSLTGEDIRAIVLDRNYCIDIDEARHVREAEAALRTGRLDIERPKLRANRTGAHL